MKHKALSFAFACALLVPSSFAIVQSAESVEGLLSTDRVGAKKFLKSHPFWNRPQKGSLRRPKVVPGSCQNMSKNTIF